MGVIKKVEAGEIKLPLGLHNQKLPEETQFPILPIPMPYELDTGEKIVVHHDPPDAIVVNDAVPLNMENVTVDTLPDETPAPVLKEVPNIIPCVIKIRKLTDADVNLWKPKLPVVPTPLVPLPDETEIDGITDNVSTPPPKNKEVPTPNVCIVAGYGLRNRPKPLRTNRVGMARASKDKVSFAGVFSTDESSQDSRMPATEVETDEDSTPPPPQW